MAASDGIHTVRGVHMPATSIDPLESFPRRSLPARIAHGVSWRLAGLRSRLRTRFPPVLSVARELSAVTGKSSAGVASDLLYARTRFGFAPHDFAALMLWDVARESWGDFLLSDELDDFLIRHLEPADRALSHDKVASAEKDRERGTPWLPTLAVINRKQGLLPAGAVVVERAVDFWPALERLTAREKVVVKPASGMQGRGLHVVSAGGNAVDADGRRVDPDELVRRVFAYRDKHGDFGYLAQPLLVPHASIVALTGVVAPASLRIVTLRHASGNFTLQAFLKIPAPGRWTDNFRRGVSGTLIAPVDPGTGRLGPLLGLLGPRRRYVLERTATHPATGREITGRELPAWKEAFAIADLAAAARPRSPMFAWDVAMGPSGWVLLDANAVWGPTGGQACSGRGLRPLLARFYPEWR